MNNQRTLKNLKDNIENNNTLPYLNILALLDAYGYGTATPMQALISTLKYIYSKIQNNEVIKYFDENNIERTVDKNSFPSFVLKYSDDFVLKHVYKE